MQILLGALAGYACGWAVWRISRQFVPLDGIAAETQGHALTQLSNATHDAPLLAALIQLSMVCWGVYAGWNGSEPAATLLIIVTSGALLAITVIDQKTHRIPSMLIFVLLICAILQVLLLSQPELRSAVLGLLVCGGIFFAVAIIGHGAMGVGDVKLAAAIGALLGFPAALHGLFLGIVFGGLAAAFLLLTRRAGRKDSFAYGPYLAVGAWIMLVQAWGLWPV